MKTIVIFNEIPEIFSWFEGDKSWHKFQGVYINQCTENKRTEKLQTELTKKVFHAETGQKLFPMNSFDEPLIITEPTTIISCGFLL